MCRRCTVLLPVRSDHYIGSHAWLGLVYDLPKGTESRPATAPKYQAVAGLIRKYYVLAQDGKTAGGIYLWKSQAEAQALYTESWKAFVRERYGCYPSVVYMDSPVVVDNLWHEIIADK